MNGLISIIIPVYNVEKYLDRCLESVVSQTYNNLEIILVDDGSTDSSSRLSDDWAKKDKRINVFHKENGGLSDARNYGVTKSKGTYIFFVDSDDCISEKTIEILNDLLTKNDADIACCNYVKFSNEEPDYSFENDCLVLDGGEQACTAMMRQKTFMITAWGNLVKREIVVNNPFPVGRYQEDEATTYKYYYASQKTVVTDAKLYGYFYNEKGIMKSPENRKKNTLDLLKSLEEQLDFFEAAQANDLYKLVFTRYIRCYLESITKKYIDKDKQTFKSVIKYDKKNCKESKRFKFFLFTVSIFGNLPLLLAYKK